MQTIYLVLILIILSEVGKKLLFFVISQLWPTLFRIFYSISSSFLADLPSLFSQKMAHNIKKQASIATIGQLLMKKPIAFQTASKPILLSPFFLSYCQDNTQLIQDLFTEDDVPLIYTYCHAIYLQNKIYFKKIWVVEKNKEMKT